MRFLDDAGNPKLPFIHRDIATWGELRFCLKKWTQKAYQQKYPILYPAFHGSRGQLTLAKENGRSQDVPLDDIFEALGENCRGTIILFSACDTLQIHGNSVQRYLRKSRAAAVCGYAGTVSWYDSTLLDLMLLHGMQKGTKSFTPHDARGIKRRVCERAKGFIASLQFQMVVRGGMR